MAQTNTAICVNGLEKSYKKLKVLEKVYFKVQKGNIFALLGSNGAGKTTTIKILTTLLTPDRGNAQVGGFDVVKQPDCVREAISLTGQYAAVDEILTGRENLRMIGKLRHLPGVSANADEAFLRCHHRNYPMSSIFSLQNDNILWSKCLVCPFDHISSSELYTPRVF